MGFGMGKGSSSPREIETSSLGNILLILGGVKTRFVGLQTPVERGELVYITRSEDGLKVPVIVDTVEEDRLLSTIPWHQAGHTSAAGYLARLTGNPTALHAASSASNLAVDEAVINDQLKNGTARTFTFHVATAAELTAAGLDDRAKSAAVDGARAALKAFDEGLQSGSHPEAVNDALSFAQSVHVDANQLREMAGLALASMRPQRGGPGQHGF